MDQQDQEHVLVSSYNGYPELVGQESQPPAPDHEIDGADLLGLFIQQTRHIPLLTPHREASLAWEVQCGQQAVQALEESDNLPQHLIDELSQAIEAAQRAREVLAESNVRLVMSTAKDFLWSGLPLEDLVQEGNTGLMLAIDRFDPALGNRFSTYARWWIRQSIRRAIMKTAHTVRLPEHKEIQRQRCYAARDVLRQSLEREPTAAEVGRAVKLPEDTVEWLLAYERTLTSLNDLVGQDSEVGDMLTDVSSPDPEEVVTYSLLKEAVEQALNLLPRREADIIRMRYGLSDGIKWTIEQVASVYDLSRARIRQLETAALKRLHQSPYAEQLNMFMEN